MPPLCHTGGSAVGGGCRSRGIDKQAQVGVSYSRRHPSRIAVHGYDVRKREPVPAGLGLLTTLVVLTVYFQLIQS